MTRKWKYDRDYLVHEIVTNRVSLSEFTKICTDIGMSPKYAKTCYYRVKRLFKDFKSIEEIMGPEGMKKFQEQLKELMEKSK